MKSESMTYSPIKYKKFLFFERDKSFMFPLGITDPLNIINSFIDTLNEVWNYKDQLKCFNLFRFQGLGLLQGKRHNSDKLETIIAYCGGFIDGQGKCGNTPLIIGRENTCELCGKLICPRCNYCSNDCRRSNQQ